MATISRDNDNGITAQYSSFSQVGDGRWSGTVVIKDGPEFECEELANHSWRVSSAGAGRTGKTSVTERSLERALLKALLKTAPSL